MNVTYRSAAFVYDATTEVEFTSTANVAWWRLNPATRTAEPQQWPGTGVASLEPGVHAFLSNSPFTVKFSVNGIGLFDLSLRGGTDPWPDPPPTPQGSYYADPEDFRAAFRQFVNSL